MDIQDVIKLVNAGFTKEEILAFPLRSFPPQEQGGEPAAPQAPSPEPVEKEAPAPAEAPASAEAAAPAATDNSAVLAALEKLTAVVQKQAIRSDALQPDKKLSAEDILAEVINPKNTK